VLLVDTNVVSELRRGRRGNPGVAAWFASVVVTDLFISVLVLGELRKGVAIARRRGDVIQATNLDTWLQTFSLQFADRILPVDADVADAWGRVHVIRDVPAVDGLLAATAIVHGLTLVTRNISDVQGLGADLLNPFTT
jgi:predicted nucleic acid-binding protein